MNEMSIEDVQYESCSPAVRHLLDVLDGTELMTLSPIRRRLIEIAIRQVLEEAGRC